MKIFYLPDLGEGLAEAEIREWYVKEGEEVKVDQPLVSMETAKAVVDVPSPYAGKIVSLHGQPNSIIKTGAPLISFAGDVTQTDQGSVVGKLESSEATWNDDHVLPTNKSTSTAIKAMPAARVLAKQMNVDLTQIKGSGPGNLITPDDVKQFLTQTPSKQLSGDTEVLHGVRRAMAHTMAKAHAEIVPVTIVEDADISDLPKDTDITARLLKAMALAVKKEPSLNAWFDGKQLERKLLSEVHIGLAADTEEGLFVPVIKNVEQLSLAALREKINDLKIALKNRSVSAADMQGATITLSNFGNITGRYATPIIVPPMVAILGCGRSREIAIPKNGQVVIGRILPLSLTIDHRAVTGGEASRYLGEVIRILREGE